MPTGFRAKLDGNEKLATFSVDLERAVIETIEEGHYTKDLAICVHGTTKVRADAHPSDTVSLGTIILLTPGTTTTADPSRVQSSTSPQRVCTSAEVTLVCGRSPVSLPPQHVTALPHKAWTDLNHASIMQSALISI